MDGSFENIYVVVDGLLRRPAPKHLTLGSSVLDSRWNIKPMIRNQQSCLRRASAHFRWCDSEYRSETT